MSEDHLFVVRVRHQPAAGALAPTLIAAAAIAVGVAFYAFARPQPALFLPAGWHRPLPHALPTLLLGALPTFVHALALPLLIVAVLPARRRVALSAVCVAWCVVEIAFESAQHPRIGHALLERWTIDERWHARLAPLANFVRNGTFDRIDLAAAVLGSLAAYAVLCRLIETRATNAEGRHV